MSADDITVDLNLWPRQFEAFESPATELLFGGASEGGKSHLVRVASIAWCLEIPNLIVKIFRKHYDEVVGNHMEGPGSFHVLLQELVASGRARITYDEVHFDNGSAIFLRPLRHDDDLEKHRGRETHVAVFEEATQIPERYYRFIRGWVRMPLEMQNTLPEHLKGRFPRIINTANPIGVSAPYFRRNFVKARPWFEVWRTPPDEGGFLRQFIPSRVEDNKSADPVAMRARLMGLGDEGIANALIEGNWDSPVGDFFPEYDERRHVIPDIVPPAHWFRYRSFDWGSAEPFCVHWYAVSDGKEFEDHKKRKHWYPRGALVVYREWYGAMPKDPAKGLRLRNDVIAAGILERSPNLEEKNLVTLTDSLPFQDRGGQSIELDFKQFKNNAGERCFLSRGDDSRIPGWTQIRARLKGKELEPENFVPMIYLCESCHAARDYLPALPRHKTKLEDAEESGEATHACDSIRYGCMAKGRVRQAPAKPEDLKNLRSDVTMDQAIKKIQRKKRGAHGGY